MTILAHEKEILEFEQTIEKLKKQNSKNSLLSNSEIEKLESKLNDLKTKIYSDLTPWQRVAICRHPKRPHSYDYINNLCQEFEEFFGDRTFKDDRAIITGFGKINAQKYVIIGIERGKDTDSRVERNFGMPHPEGYRKALRAMKLAEKFKLPVITLIDTQGAYPGLTAEERGQGAIIAKNLFEMAQLETIIISIIIGEGCSGGAIGIGVGDIVGMLEHSYYSVISPEGCASILWKDAKKNELAASILKMHAENLIEYGVIDSVIKEPLGGAHKNTSLCFENVLNFIETSFESLKNIPTEKLVENRYQKYRKIGEFDTI